MTSQKDIQSLIAAIDSILPKVGTRLPWSKPSDITLIRQVLEQVRNHLVSLQPNRGAIPEPFSGTTAPTQPGVTQQMAQAVAQEMTLLRTDLIQPLRTELTELRSERDSLIREIRQLENAKQQLESQSQQYAAQAQLISQLSQELIQRCTEGLTQQLTQVFVEAESRWDSRTSTSEGIAPTPSAPGKSQSMMHPQERLEHLRQLQTQSDHLLSTLDANQRVLFETLERNLHSYQESLSQGLDKMYSLSVQGEMLFTALVNRLAQQLGRETSTMLQSSLQLPDSVHPANAAASQTIAEALPTDAIRLTQQTLTPSPNPLTQIPLSQPIESSSLASEIAPASMNDSGTVSDAADSLHALSESLSQDIHPGNLRAEDWEITAGLDFEDLDLELEDEMDTLIQIDIEPQSSRPAHEAEATAEQTWTAQTHTSHLDNADGILNANSWMGNQPPQDSAPPIPQTLRTSSDVRRDIDELYESLFGASSFTDTSQQDESQTVTPQPPTSETDSFAILDESQIPEAREISSLDSIHPLSTPIEEALFEGLIDPASASPQTPALDSSAGQRVDSWDALFSDDSATPLTSEAAAVSPSIISAFNLEQTSEQEGIKTITALTDLFEEMGLKSLPSPVATDSTTAAAESGVSSSSSGTGSQAGLDEDEYIPASPEEDLLATDELESEPDREILLEQSTLQQLSNDLYSFEGSEYGDFLSQTERLFSDSDLDLAADETPPPQTSQPNHWFPISEELLAEDWEEFALNDVFEPDTPSASEMLTAPELSSLDSEPAATDENENAATVVPEPETERSDLSTPVVQNAVTSDFDPNLFPSEVLELDQHQDETLDSATLDGIAESEEPLALEDETFVEIAWDDEFIDDPDDPIVDITLSSELESELNRVSEAMMDEELANSDEVGEVDYDVLIEDDISDLDSGDTAFR
ncbi:MAG TPA: hypothetical protein V6C95_11890 [Coleofasciculaceae cyanobacterium]